MSTFIFNLIIIILTKALGLITFCLDYAIDFFIVRPIYVLWFLVWPYIQMLLLINSW